MSCISQVHGLELQHKYSPYFIKQLKIHLILLVLVNASTLCSPVSQLSY